MSEQDETVIQGEGGELPQSMAQLEQELVDAAVESGMITRTQAEDVSASFENLVIGSDLAGPDEDTPCTAADRTVSVMVDKGLISQEAGEELKQKVVGGFLPGYSLEGELGRGAMGVVYKAVQQKLDRPVALKVINPKLSCDRSYVTRFKREALTLAKLNHPNIVQVYDYGEETGKIFLALEFVKGRDCSEIIKERGKLPEKEALRIIRDAALGLSHAHQHGIVHRDVKPANMMVLEGRADAAGGGTVTKVMDLGLAREADPKEGQAELTQAGTILGSPAYMAPEQTEGKPADFRSDIYALGASLYHMITGAIPFSSSSVINVLVKKRTETLPNPKDTQPELSEGLIRILDRMLARPAEERYESYEALLADLEASLAGKLPSTGPVKREASSLRLTGRLAKAEGSALSTPQQEVRGDAPAEPSGPGGLIALVAILAVAVGIGFLFQADGKPQDVSGGGPDTPATTGGGPPPIDGPPDVPVQDLASLEANNAKVLEEARALYAAGDYEALGNLTSDHEALLRSAGGEPPNELVSLKDKAVLAAADGAGATERKAWSDAQASEDPLKRLELLEGFRERFGAFSPDVEAAERLYAEAEAQAPEVELEASPRATALSVDGESVGNGAWKGRLARGEHTVEATSEGHFPLETTLRVEGPLRRTLHLGPRPKVALKQNPQKQRRVWSKKKFFQQWQISGSWKPLKTQAGTLGETAGSTATRDLSELVEGLESVSGWSFQWEVLPAPHQDESKMWVATETSEALAGFAAEARLLGDGTSAIVFGAKGGTVYAGVRSGDSLDVRFELQGETPPRNYELDYDGDVAVLLIDQKPVWSLRPEWKPKGVQVELAVLEGSALFQNFKLIGLEAGE